MELIDVVLPGFPNAPLQGALATDTGQHREHNEDAVGFYLPEAPSDRAPADAVVLVADGVGGHEGGRWASRFVVDAVHDTVAAQAGRIEAPQGWLDRLLRSIHRELLTEAEERGSATGMGSTATIALLQGRTLTLAHVGDSRAYRLRNGHLEQLTRDHSWVAEQIRAGVLDPDDPEAAARKNVLTQCLGIGRSLDVQTCDEKLSPGDRFLLCSDGLHGVVPDEVLRRTLSGAGDPESTARRLVALANEGGGPDNISAVVFDIGHPAPPADAPEMGGAAHRAAAGSAPGAARASEAVADRGAGAGAPAVTGAHGAGRADASRRAAPWMTGIGALLVTVGIGAWVSGQVSARTAGAPVQPPDPVQSTPAPPPAADGEPARVPAATPSPLGAGPGPISDPDTTPLSASVLPPDTAAVATPEVESPDSSAPGPAPDGARPDTAVPPDTLPHSRPE